MDLTKKLSTASHKKNKPCKSKVLKSATSIIMKKNELKRDTKFPYAKLNVLFTEKLNFLERDADTFTKYRITQFDLLDLKTLLQKFKNMVMDPEVVLTQKNATTIKNVSIDKLYLNLCYLRIVMQNSINKQELLNQAPTIFRLNNQSDEELIMSANSAHRTALLFQSTLVKWGIDAAYLSGFKSLITEGENNIANICTSKSRRNASTVERHATANSVSQALDQICNIGKMVWTFEQDIAKYNDYILPKSYQKKSTKNTEPIQIQS